jgi:hypothetical protein
MHSWCPPATGPNQPHRDDCSHYKRPEPSASAKWAGISTFVKSPFLGHEYQAKLSVMQAQAYNHALQWLDRHSPAPLGPIECNDLCNCAAQSGVIGHASFCPLGDGTGPETASEGNAHSETTCS